MKTVKNRPIPSNDQLTAKQRNAIPHLVAAPSIEEAARRAACTKQTLYNWLAEPAFAAAYEQAQMRVYESGLAALRCAIEAGVSTMRELAEDAKQPGNVRCSAAKSLVEIAMRAHEQIVMADEIRELQAQMDAVGGPRAASQIA